MNFPLSIHLYLRGSMANRSYLTVPVLEEFIKTCTNN